jgi:hypothetical protein
LPLGLRAQPALWPLVRTIALEITDEP